MQLDITRADPNQSTKPDPKGKCRNNTDPSLLTQTCPLLQDLQLYLSNLANQIDRETGIGDVPLVILLDDLSEAGSISELVNGALTCKYHKW